MLFCPNSFTVVKLKHERTMIYSCRTLFLSGFDAARAMCFYMGAGLIECNALQLVVRIIDGKMLVLLLASFQFF